MFFIREAELKYVPDFQECSKATVGIFDDETPIIKPDPDPLREDKDFFLTLPIPQFSWASGYANGQQDKPDQPRVIQTFCWPDYLKNHLVLNKPKKKKRPPKRVRMQLSAAKLDSGNVPRVKEKALTTTVAKSRKTVGTSPKSEPLPKMQKKNPNKLSITVEIINTKDEKNMLKDTEFTSLMDSLLQKWDKFPLDADFVPKFNMHGCKKGIGFIICADEGTYKWTLETISEIGQQMAPDVMIKTVVNSTLPGFTKAIVTIPFT